MESRGQTEVNIAIGEMPNQPGTSVSFDLFIGEGHTSKLKQEIQSKTGHQPENFHAYVSLLCGSAESATTLKDLLTTTWNSAMSGEGNDELSAMLKMGLKPDDDEPAHISVEFSAQDNMLVAKLSPSESQTERISAMHEMVASTASGILAVDQNIHLEFDVGKTLSEVLHSDNLAIAFLNSIRFNLLIGINTALAGQVTEIMEGFGLPSQMSRIAHGAGLYESGSLDLKFASADSLPDTIKQKLTKRLSGFSPSAVRDNVPEQVRALIQAFNQHANGELMMAAGADNVMVQFKVHAPGLSQFFTN